MIQSLESYLASCRMYPALRYRKQYADAVAPLADIIAPMPDTEVATWGLSAIDDSLGRLLTKRLGIPDGDDSLSALSIADTFAKRLFLARRMGTLPVQIGDWIDELSALSVEPKRTDNPSPHLALLLELRIKPTIAYAAWEDSRGTGYRLGVARGARSDFSGQLRAFVVCLVHHVSLCVRVTRRLGSEEAVSVQDYPSCIWCGESIKRAI